MFHTNGCCCVVFYKLIVFFTIIFKSCVLQAYHILHNNLKKVLLYKRNVFYNDNLKKLCFTSLMCFIWLAPTTLPCRPWSTNETFMVANFKPSHFLTFNFFQPNHHKKLEVKSQKMGESLWHSYRSRLECCWPGFDSPLKTLP